MKENPRNMTKEDFVVNIAGNGGRYVVNVKTRLSKSHQWAIHEDDEL